jgi:uncharacterized protein
MIHIDGIQVTRPLVVGVAAGAVAQAVKLASFLLLEKRINFRRLVESDGAPNMHGAVFAGLSTAVAQQDGLSSLLFAVAGCFGALVTVDLWNVKRAASRQAQVVDLLLNRLRPRGVAGGRRPLSFTVLDVLAGTALGVAMAFVI